MRFWVGLSVALHLAALLFLILDVLPRRIPEPEDIAIPVELIIPMPPQQARGDVAAPRPAPDQVPAPPRLNRVVSMSRRSKGLESPSGTLRAVSVFDAS
jgi:hypothetical protein